MKKEWEMYFDDASKGLVSALGDNSYKSSKIGIIFVTLDNVIIMHSLTQSQGCFNNETECEALITRLELA